MAPAAAAAAMLNGSSSSTSSSNSKRVCVMDASGRLGSTLVHRLLTRGYTVHAALQNHAELQEFEGLSVGDSKRLKVFQSDSLDYHSIVDAMKGCCGLFYSFEPPSDHPIYDRENEVADLKRENEIADLMTKVEEAVGDKTPWNHRWKP